VKENESENKKCFAVYLLELFEMKIHIKLQDLVLKPFMAYSLLNTKISLASSGIKLSH